MASSGGEVRPPLPGTEEEASDGLLLRVLAPGAMFWRMHRSDQRALFFGGADVEYRFNDPGPRAAHPDAPPAYASSRPDRGKYGVCYFGFQQETAFVETFLRRPSKRRDISEAEIQLRRISEVRSSRPIRLIQLDGPGLARAGVDGSVVSGPDYSLSRTVSRLLWSRGDGPDGILYAARHDNHLYAAALFNRAEKAVTAGAAQEIDDDLLRSLLKRYRFRLV